MKFKAKIKFTGEIEIEGEADTTESAQEQALDEFYSLFIIPEADEVHIASEVESLTFSGSTELIQ